jgi:hypothetical protein
MANPTTLQSANPNISTVPRKPQTTAVASAAGVPFVRLARKAQIQGFATAGNAFGSLITQPLKAVGGYLRGFFLTVQAVGGTGVAAVAAADAPDNVISALLLRDPLGQPIIQVDSFGLRLIMNYSGQFGMAGFQDPHALPSYSAIAVTGNFTIRFYIPIELDSSAYCTLASLNASAVPTLTLQIAPTATVYSTPPTGVPTLTITCNQLYWAAPVGAPDTGPPDIGSSAQWSQSIAFQAPPSAAYARVVLPRVGTYIHTLILVVRDSTGARVDVWPLNDITLFVDGVPLIFRSEGEHYDQMFVNFGLGKFTGVLWFTFRTAVQQLVGEADTHDELLPTTPATLLELGGVWQTITNQPAQITVYTGELYPVGGIPWNHLAS